METKTRYLLIRLVGGKWSLPTRKLFDDEMDAWEWVDTRFKTDDERHQFYLEKIELPEPVTFARPLIR